MASILEDQDIVILPVVRLALIGGRWAGKSSSANTILRKERFESGRMRTVQSEVRHEVVEDRKLIVVDAPGWSNSLSLAETPERDKQRFKLIASKCPPGPNTFLLVIPVDSAFTAEQKKTTEEHMKLLGDGVWRYTMVLFTFGDFLGEKTIEQHIESEGEALKWVIEKCRNRYHVFNNKDKSNSSQVSLLLEKIDEMVLHNNGGHFELDEHTLKLIEKREQEVADKAEKRRRRAEEQMQHMMTLIPEDMTPIQKLRMVLLGSRNVGKTSTGNTILGFKEQEHGKRTAHAVAWQGFVNKTEITLVDTPGWWKDFPAFDTPEAIKEEVRRSVFLCLPGPHIFLLVIDPDASFNARHLKAVTTHLELLGEEVWRHTFIVFTRGDWLGSNTIEKYIEGEGEALQSLVERCGNRYHLLNNKNESDGTQTTELLQKITGTVAGNDWDYFVPDEQVYVDIELRRRKVEEGAMLRQIQVESRRKSLKGSRKKLKDLKIVMLGQKKFGKTTTGNTILCKEGLSAHHNQQCQVEVGDVAGRLVTVIDTPGWWHESPFCPKEMDKEIVRGLSLIPSGVHAVLLVITLDLKLRESQQDTLRQYMNLFNDNIWKHTMVLFTYGDKLADKSVEEHIEREHRGLLWLVDKCENKYHVINNLKTTDIRQVVELFEKIEEMVAGNGGRLFCPNMRQVHLRIEEKSRRRQLEHVLKQEVRRREVELMKHFRGKLLELQTYVRETATSSKSKLLIGDISKIKTIGHKKRDEKEEKLDAKIKQEIEMLDEDIMRSSDLLHGSMEFVRPDLTEDRPASSIPESVFSWQTSNRNLERFCDWLSNLQSSTNVDNQLTLNMSESSGYRSEFNSFNIDRFVDE